MTTPTFQRRQVVLLRFPFSGQARRLSLVTPQQHRTAGRMRHRWARFEAPDAQRQDLRLHFVFDDLKPWVLEYLRIKAGRVQIEVLVSGNQESMRNIG